LILCLVAGCSAPGAASQPADYAEGYAVDQGYAMDHRGLSGGERRPTQEVLTLDDVTNGLQMNPARLDTLAEAEDPGAVAPGNGAPDRMLVYRGRIDVEVSRTDEASTKFLAEVVAWGGHLQQQEQRAERGAVILTVRVPAAHFDEAFTALREAGRVLGESRQAEDVTEEFLDLGIRLDNAIKSRDRLLEVLAKASKVEDVLAVEKELRRLTEEIERMEGRRKFLADRVAMATIAATFLSNQDAPPPVKKRRPSRFDWINSLGPRRVMEGY